MDTCNKSRFRLYAFTKEGLHNVFTAVKVEETTFEDNWIGGKLQRLGCIFHVLIVL